VGYFCGRSRPWLGMGLGDLGRGDVGCELLLPGTLDDSAGFLFIFEVDVWGVDACARSRERLGVGISTCGRSS
jgi:hypothetical protein